MASDHPYPNPTQDPAFYCFGQACMDDGCTPLFCKDESERAENEAVEVDEIGRWVN